MCGKAYDPRFIFAWPTARYAVMSGDSAAGTLVEIKIKQLEREGKDLDDAAKKELYESIQATYEHQTDPRYAAARLWVDAIIDPAQTREALIEALESAALNPEVREFKTGVLGPSLPAIGAEPAHFRPRDRDFQIAIARDLLFQFLVELTFKLANFPTTNACDVDVVARPMTLVEMAIAAQMKQIQFVDQAMAFQQVDCAIHSDARDVGIDLTGIEMPARSLHHL
jgi:hypothetical protein